MPKVNPTIMKWARETAGLDLDTAARKIGLGAARGVQGAVRLAALENGEGDPTRALLTRMAKQYRRPLVVFYLDQPPAAADRGEDFRTASDEAPKEEAPLLDALLRSVLARQSMVRAALAAEDDVERVELVGLGSLDLTVGAAAEEIGHFLEFDRTAFRRKRTYSEAFALLRSWVEDSGIFVLLIGDLGSPRHNSISTETFRGYALADDIAPFIVINDQDAHAAWSFTLLHEVCHLFLGTTGVSDVYGSTQTERFCNDVASNLLLGDEELAPLARTIHQDAGAGPEAVTAFATAQKVSRTLVAYRLQRIGALTWDEFAAMRDDFYREWRDQKRQVRETARLSDEQGPTYYIVRRHRLGKGLLGTVTYLLESGALTTTRAGQVLGVKAKNVPELLGRAPKAAGV